MKWFFWRRNAELREELDAHLLFAEREALESGHSCGEARRLARREFGNVAVAEEITRDNWGWLWLADMFQDARYGLRALRKIRASPPSPCSLLPPAAAPPPSCSPSSAVFCLSPFPTASRLALFPCTDSPLIGARRRSPSKGRLSGLSRLPAPKPLTGAHWMALYPPRPGHCKVPATSSFLPARRASQLDPVRALRQE